MERVDSLQDVLTIDVSSKSPEWNVLSASYAHGDIPVPGMPGTYAQTVEGIWEGLKQFQFVGEDLSLLESEKPKKRRQTEDSGSLTGYSYAGKTINDEIEARRRIFIPVYTWMVKNAPAARAKFDELVDLARTNTLHIHDGGENGNVGDEARPYAYAALLAELVKEARKEKAAALVEA
jgi:hypothetical protein